MATIKGIVREERRRQARKMKTGGRSVFTIVQVIAKRAAAAIKAKKIKAKRS